MGSQHASKLLLSNTHYKHSITDVWRTKHLVATAGARALQRGKRGGQGCWGRVGCGAITVYTLQHPCTGQTNTPPRGNVTGVHMAARLLPTCVARRLLPLSHAGLTHAPGIIVHL